MKFLYEKAAMQNEPIPHGLSMAEQKLYIALRGLYQQYKSVLINKDTASADKAKLMEQYKVDSARETAAKHVSALLIQIEPYAAQYAKTGSADAADAFYRAVYGLPKEWKIKRSANKQDTENEDAQNE